MSRLTPEREADIEAAFDTSQYWVEGDEVFAELRALRAELAEATAERDRSVPECQYVELGSRGHHQVG